MAPVSASSNTAALARVPKLVTCACAMAGEWGVATKMDRNSSGSSMAPQRRRAKITGIALLHLANGVTRQDYQVSAPPMATLCTARPRRTFGACLRLETGSGDSGHGGGGIG